MEELDLEVGVVARRVQALNLAKPVGDQPSFFSVVVSLQEVDQMDIVLRRIIEFCAPLPAPKIAVKLHERLEQVQRSQPTEVRVMTHDDLVRCEMGMVMLERDCKIESFVQWIEADLIGACIVARLVLLRGWSSFDTTSGRPSIVDERQSHS
jgi:hypothetical protein